MPFAEPAKTVLSVAPKNLGKEAVETNAIRPSSEHKASGFPPMSSKNTVVNVQNDAFADHILQVPTEFPQIRTERVGETRRNLETDACSGHSQTSGDKPTVSGDQTSIRRSQSWHSPRLCRRFAKVDDFWQLRARTLVVRAPQ